MDIDDLKYSDESAYIRIVTWDHKPQGAWQTWLEELDQRECQGEKGGLSPLGDLYWTAIDDVWLNVINTVATATRIWV